MFFFSLYWWRFWNISFEYFRPTRALFKDSNIIPWRIFLDVSYLIYIGKCFVLSGFHWIATRFGGIKPLIKRSREKNILDHQSFKCTAESDLYFVFCIQKQLSRGNKLCSPLCILVVEFFFIFTFLFFLFRTLYFQSTLS